MLSIMIMYYFQQLINLYNINGKEMFMRKNKKWIDVCKEVKKLIAAKKMGYSQTTWTKITIGGVTQTLRTDCSGYVTACLQYYGVLKPTAFLYTGIMGNTSPVMKNTGFKCMPWCGVMNLLPGDILVTPGSHTEIFAYREGNKGYVYNCGSDYSCNSAVPTPMSRAAYTWVWRCPEYLNTTEKATTTVKTIINKVVTPKEKLTPNVYGRYTGSSTSVIDALLSVGVTDTSMPHRAKIAAKNNIVSTEAAYHGSVEQNTRMLQLLKAGKLIKA